MEWIKRPNSCLLFLSCFLVNLSTAFSHFVLQLNGTEFILPADRLASLLPLKMDFENSTKLCPRYGDGFVLAEITDKSTQKSISEFLNRAVGDDRLGNKDSVRAGGRLIEPEDWFWVNGQKNTGISFNGQKNTGMTPADESYAGYRPGNKKFWVFEAKVQRPYFCEYPDDNRRVCNFTVSERCFILKTNRLTWYEARNDCLDKGGDLASFEFHRAVNLSALTMQLPNGSRAWVGLTNKHYQWISNRAKISYTYWENGYAGKGGCLRLKRKQYDVPSSDWVWIAPETCTEKLPFVCAKKALQQRGFSTVGNVQPLGMNVALIVGVSAGVVLVTVAAAVLIPLAVRRSRRVAQQQSTAYETPMTANSEHQTRYEGLNVAVYDEIPEYEDRYEQPKN